MEETKRRKRNDNLREWASVFIAAIAAFAAIASFFVSCASLSTMKSVSDISNEIAANQNKIVENQVAIEKNSLTPEFVYFGTEEQTCRCENKLGQSEDHYDYGYCPVFVKASGFAANLSCEAHSHYEIEVAAQDFPNAPVSKIAIDVYGEFFSPLLSSEGSLIAVTLEESRSKFNLDLILQGLEKHGYAVRAVQSFCVGRITYADVIGEALNKPFCLDLDRKTNIVFNESHETCCGDPVVIAMDRNQPNRGITDERIEFWIQEATSRAGA